MGLNASGQKLINQAAVEFNSSLVHLQPACGLVLRDTGNGMAAQYRGAQEDTPRGFDRPL